MRTLPAAAALSPDANVSRSSPVLSIELWSSKRWGSDAVTASGELLLAPFLQRLQPNGPPLQAKVPLQKANAKAAAKAARSASTAAAVVSGSPGIESGWVLGLESQVMVLELTALTAPPLPLQLLGERQLELWPSLHVVLTLHAWQVLHLNCMHCFTLCT